PITPLLLHEHEVRAAHFSFDGRLILTASRDKTARVWDSHTGRLLATLPHDEAVVDAQFHPDNQRVISVAANVVQIWDGRAGRRLLGPLVLDASAGVCGFSHDGCHFLTASDA